jgi:hypothetical protein
MKQGPSSEANSSSASKEIPNIWENPTVQYRLHMSPPLVPILSQTNSLRTLSFRYFKIYFNIILQFTANYSRGLFPSRFILKTLGAFTFSPMCCNFLLFMQEFIILQIY